MFSPLQNELRLEKGMTEVLILKKNLLEIGASFTKGKNIPLNSGFRGNKPLNWPFYQKGPEVQIRCSKGRI